MLLRLAQKGLQADIRDKKTAADVDSGIVRLHRQRANHRWVLDGQAPSVRPAVKLYCGGGTSSSLTAPAGGGAAGSLREDTRRRGEGGGGASLSSGRSTDTY